MKRGERSAAPAQADTHFYVPPFLHILGGLVERQKDLFLRLGRLESSRLREQIDATSIRLPVYVCGLARSGSTLLHEIVSAHPAIATHRLKDYPMLFTPYWWRRATANMRTPPPRERPHRDRMMITTESPDALEEMLWMAFFPRCHDPAVSCVLRRDEQHPEFESFYRDHIRKLLLVENKSRYAAKANYHVARLAYLVRLFPDARFLVPVRGPESHIASLLRQHRLFSAGQRHRPRALAYMRRSGHFEFGLDRRPMHLHDPAKLRRVLEAWSAGDEIRGLAIYWDLVYGYLARLLATDEKVRDAALIVRFETLCAEPAATLRGVFEHCRLANAEEIVARHTAQVSAPAYYKSGFSAEDQAVIHAETASTARLWGY